MRRKLFTNQSIRETAAFVHFSSVSTFVATWPEATVIGCPICHLLKDLLWLKMVQAIDFCQIFTVNSTYSMLLLISLLLKFDVFTPVNI